MAKRIKAKKVGKTIVFKAQPQSDPFTSVIEQNKVVDGICVRVRQGNTIAEIPLSRFLQKFETPKQRAAVQTAVHATLRMNGKTEQQIAAKRAELMKDERSRAAYWNCDDFNSISGIRDAENWVEGELEKFMNG